MILPDRIYDALKWIVMIALPALEALWLTLASIWAWPYAVAVGATIAALTVFLGALIGISNHNYKKGGE